VIAYVAASTVLLQLPAYRPLQQITWPCILTGEALLPS